MLITEGYRQLNAASHAANPKWGRGGLTWHDKIKDILKSAAAKSVIDYGCGKGDMVHALRAENIFVQGYDPAVPEFWFDPVPSDFLISLDVLEHIEPDCLEDVLKHIACLAPKALLVIALRSAKHILPDGRNAHLIVENSDWWLQKLSEHFGNFEEIEGLRASELAVLCSR
ncbi:MAG: methyltransferase domain-containing protein [Alphaproteobacteria bacterium]